MPPGKSENLRARQTWGHRLARARISGQGGLGDTAWQERESPDKANLDNLIRPPIRTQRYEIYANLPNMKSDFYNLLSRRRNRCKAIPQKSSPRHLHKQPLPFLRRQRLCRCPKNKFFIIFSRLSHDLPPANRLALGKRHEKNFFCLFLSLVSRFGTRCQYLCIR